MIDSDVAYVGGLDLCYGRWDTQAHELVDDCRTPALLRRCQPLSR